ncbi:MAG: DUF1800 domain-containing protein [Sphingobium sp.]|nr:DUF1800 domain-containing protein [Sphingobium sp.]
MEEPPKAGAGNPISDEAVEAGQPGSISGAAASVSLLALSACGTDGIGGGAVTIGGGSTGTPTPTPSSISQAQASRFLSQATMGPTSSSISAVQQSGYDAWISDQMVTPRTTSHWDWLVAKGYNASTNINGTAGFDNTMWRQLIVSPDQLRQRVGMALLEIMVVGIDGIQLNWKQFAMAAYVDVLLDNAFGNFRTLLEKVTTNAAMGSFLTFLNNRKANSATGSVPDENYARELMQLFTLGLYRLNMDGSQQMTNGSPTETYTQSDVAGLARVFTGLSLDSSDSTTPDRYRRPLVINASIHETGISSFLGTTVPAGTEGMAAVQMALDTIFAHQNVAPFVSKQLIMRLVTSNPSPGYVSRVAAAFSNNGSGVRGDMKAVIRAILLDSEARADPSGTTAGKLREPVMRLTGWARAFGASSPSDLWAIGDTSSSSTRLAQSMGRSGSVFNFFRPGYAPPNTAISNNGMVAPEFQITNELSTIGYINFMQTLIGSGIGDVRAAYDDLQGSTNDAQALVDAVNLVLAAGQVSAATIATIKTAVEGASTAANKINIAVLLVMASPEYLALK